MVRSIKNTFKIILLNSDNQEIDLDYKLHDSLLAQKWAKKIKHLHRIPIDPVESYAYDLSDIETVYKEFCNFAKLQPIDINPLDQSILNELHEIYEEQHEELSKHENNEILYKFHQSIHFNEDPERGQGEITIGWGTKEGPLTEQFDCHSYYTNKIEQNNIYLPWTELGKEPVNYWRDKEPNEQKRFMELCKPHQTFRAKFFISLHDRVVKKFTLDFIQWFAQYKKDWLETHQIKDYTEIHHYSAPLLAHTNNKQDLTGSKFVRIEL